MENGKKREELRHKCKGEERKRREKEISRWEMKRKGWGRKRMGGKGKKREEKTRFKGKTRKPLTSLLLFLSFPDAVFIFVIFTCS